MTDDELMQKALEIARGIFPPVLHELDIEYGDGRREKVLVGPWEEYGLPEDAKVVGIREVKPMKEALARRLVEALVALTPSWRALGCWCSQAHDVPCYGHEDRCKKASAALSEAMGSLKGEISLEQVGWGSWVPRVRWEEEKPCE